MGRRSFSGGVWPLNSNRIQFTFQIQGRRYRPSLAWVPTETALRQARQYLVGIKARIATGTFCFAEDFPDYRHLGRVPLAGSPRTCS